MSELNGGLRPTLETVKAMEAGRDVSGLLGLLVPSTLVVVRRAAARSLAATATYRQVPELVEHLEAETDRGVRLALVQALGRLGDDQALPVLLAALKDREIMVREEAATALSRYNSPAAYEALLEALKFREGTESWQVRRQAAQALGRLGDRRAVPVLIEALKDESSLVHPAAAQALGQLGDRSAIEALKRARHVTPHQRGADCATCPAIDAALRLLEVKEV